MKDFIQIFRPKQDGEMTINEFKGLVLDELMEFVMAQDPTKKLLDEEWAEKYADFMMQKENE